MSLGLAELWEPYKRFVHAGLASVDAVHLAETPCRCGQTCNAYLRNRRSVRENECARGGQTPGAAPLNPLETEWHVP